jgi:hypothetical protein
MEERNPYAPPKAFVGEKTHTNCTRDGKSVVIPKGGDLPQRCIICNADAETPVKKKKLYWHTPWLYLLILFNILIYAIVATIARKSIKVSPGLCAEHTSIRRRRVGGLLAVGAVGIVAGAIMWNYEIVPGAIVAFGLALIALIVAGFASRKVYAQKITSEYARIGGCKEPFLASLE